MSHHEFFRIREGLRAERSAGIGAHDMHVRRVEVERSGIREAVGMGTLAARVHGEHRAVPLREHAAALDWSDRDAWVPRVEPNLDQGVVGYMRRTINPSEPQCHVGASQRVDEYVAAIGIGDGRYHGEWLVLDDHRLGCVDRCAETVGDHGHHRFTGESHGVAGQQAAGHGLLEQSGLRRAFDQVQIVGGDHGDHPGEPARLDNIDAHESRVSHRRADEPHDRRTGGQRRREVRDEASFAGEQSLVLDSSLAVSHRLPKLSPYGVGQF